MTRFDFLRRLITGATGYLLGTLTRGDEPPRAPRTPGRAAALEGEPGAVAPAPGRAGGAERLLDIDGATIDVLAPEFEPRFDARGNVLNFRDVLSRVQAVLDGRTRSVIVRVPGDREYFFSGEHADGSRASIANPIVGLRFTIDGCWVESDGAVIRMSDWTQADARAAGVDSTSQDCFKLFSWRDGVVGGGTNGSFRVLGESDGSVLDTGPAPRAVAFSIDGASSITIAGCEGDRIVGNLVMARGHNARAGVPSRCEKVVVRDCRATRCAENGFNFMGGTYRCAIHDCVGEFNLAAGFESGTRESLVCNGNTFRFNKNGISQVGRAGVFTGNTLQRNTVSGLNFQYQDAGFDGAHNTVSGGVISENGAAGILGEAGTGDNRIGGGVRIYDNGTPGGANGEGIKLAATCTRYAIGDASIYDSGVRAQKYGIHIITGAEVSVMGVKTWGHPGAGLLVESRTDGLRVMNNDFRDAVTIARTTRNAQVRDNRS